MLKNLLRHIIASGSFQRQFSIIDPTSPPKGKLVNLRENLAVELSNQVRTSSYRHLQKDHRKYEIARFVLIPSFIFAAIFFFMSLNVLYIARKVGFFQLTWLQILIIQILIISLCFASATFWGWTTLSKLSRSTFDPLHSNGQDIFIKAEMNETWALFCKWAHENKPNLWIVQKDGPANLLERGFWEFSNIGIFILGDNRHRKKLLVDDRKLTSDLMISEHDWEAFQKCLHEQSGQRKNKTKATDKDATNSESPLTGVQKEYGPTSKRTPRLKLFAENQNFDQRYLRANVKAYNRTKANQACHDALMLIMENRELFKKLVSNNGLARGEDQSKFKAELQQALNNKPYPYKQIMKFRWLKMERYLTDLDIISEDELKIHKVKI